MIHCPTATQQIEAALHRSPVALLAGPRQCGKTTLARTFLSPKEPGYFDLEDPVDLERLAEPMTALRPLTGLVVIDEVQRRPKLSPVGLDHLRVMHPGGKRYPLGDGMEALPLETLASPAMVEPL